MAPGRYPTIHPIQSTYDTVSASKLSERRPLTFFHRQDTENGQKRYFFAFLQITPMQKFSGGIRGCHMKADVLEIPKMW